MNEVELKAFLLPYAKTITAMLSEPSPSVTPPLTPIVVPPAVIVATTPRLIQAADLSVVRTFSLPGSTNNGVSFEFGGQPIAYNPKNDSLFVGKRLNSVDYVAEVVANTPPAMPSFLQPFYPVVGDKMSQAGDPNLIGLSGLHVNAGGNLLGTVSEYYDATDEQRKGHFVRPADLSLGASDLFSVWDPTKTGFVAGYLADVPEEWQDRLGGPYVTGQFSLPVITRTSWGPALFAFNGLPDSPVTPLLYYTGEFPTLGKWADNSPVWGQSSKPGGVVLVGNSALFFGTNGLGQPCYGAGTGDPALAGTIESGSDKWCFDPTNGSKGPHAYPYRYQVWAYSLFDLADVKAGKKQPWEVVPYAVWELVLPTSDPTWTGIYVTFDRAHNRIYVSQLRADQDGYQYRAYIHVIEVAN